MKKPNDILYIIAVFFIILIASSCVYYYIDQDGCAYCEELNTHYITGPMCEGDAEFKRTWIDSIQIQGNRVGQNWLCEIR